MSNLIQDMTDAEIIAEMNKLTRKPMTSKQVFRYRSLSEAIYRRQEAAIAASQPRVYLRSIA